MDERGDVSLVDFGIAGRLTDERRIALVRLLLAAAREDIDAQLELLREFGAMPDDADLGELRRLMLEQRERVRSAGYRMSSFSTGFDQVAEDIGKTLRLVNRAGYRVPKELVLFLKNMLYLNGLAAAVAPDLNLLEEIQPVFLYFAEKYPTIVGGTR